MTISNSHDKALLVRRDEAETLETMGVRLYADHDMTGGKLSAKTERSAVITVAAGNPYRLNPALAAPAVSASKPNASTGPSAPVPSRPPSRAVCAPQPRIAAVKS